MKFLSFIYLQCDIFIISVLNCLRDLPIIFSNMFLEAGIFVPFQVVVLMLKVLNFLSCVFSISELVVRPPLYIRASAQFSIMKSFTCHESSHESSLCSIKG